MGLHQAFPDAEIVGVDIRPQPHYPFTFVHGDALEFSLSGFDFAWASPPCQGYSRLRHLPWLNGKVYPLLIPPMRQKLVAWGGPWIMENVEDAPMRNGVTLCGYSLGLSVYRHRKFEASFCMLAPGHRKHTVVIGRGRRVNDHRGTLNAGSAAGAWGTRQEIVTVAGGQFKEADGERAVGIDWMSKDELSQAIPPAYSRYLAQFIPVPRRAAG